MRIAIDNGNGMSCDRCGRLVMPKSKDMVKCTCLCPHDDDKKASTGYMKSIGKFDLCIDCYRDILGSIVRKPRMKEA